MPSVPNSWPLICIKKEQRVSFKICPEFKYILHKEISIIGVFGLKFHFFLQPHKHTGFLLIPGTVNSLKAMLSYNHIGALLQWGTP